VNVIETAEATGSGLLAAPRPPVPRQAAEPVDRPQPRALRAGRPLRRFEGGHVLHVRRIGEDDGPARASPPVPLQASPPVPLSQIGRGGRKA
jgi:hypothetical protein